MPGCGMRVGSDLSGIPRRREVLRVRVARVDWQLFAVPLGPVFHVRMGGCSSAGLSDPVPLFDERDGFSLGVLRRQELGAFAAVVSFVVLLAVVAAAVDASLHRLLAADTAQRVTSAGASATVAEPLLVGPLHNTEAVLTRVLVPDFARDVDLLVGLLVVHPLVPVVPLVVALGPVVPVREPCACARCL